jgi:hypothetical protein
VLPLSQKGYVGNLSSAELTVEKIAQDFGPGKYRVRGVRNNGTYAGQRTVDVAAVPTGKSNAQVTQQNSITELVAMMQLENDRRREEARERGESMRNWASILVPALAPVLAGLFGNKGPTLAELSATLANMKALSGETSQLSKVEEFAKMIEAVKALMPESADKGSTWADIARDGIAQIGPALSGMAAMRGMGVPGAPGAALTQNPAPLPTVQIPPPPGAAQEPIDMLAWLKEQLTGLVYQASLNKNPSLYAEVMLDNLPPGSDPKQLRDILSRDDWWSVLTGFFPACAPYPQWFSEARDELLKGLSEMLESVEPKGATDDKQ